MIPRTACDPWGATNSKHILLITHWSIPPALSTYKMVCVKLESCNWWQSFLCCYTFLGPLTPDSMWGILNKVGRGGFQKEAYAAFDRYVKQVASERRVAGSTTLALNNILQFVCGVDEEPVLKFSISPQIKFVSGSGCLFPIQSPAPIHYFSHLQPSQWVFLQTTL